MKIPVSFRPNAIWHFGKAIINARVTCQIVVSAFFANLRKLYLSVSLLSRMSLVMPKWSQHKLKETFSQTDYYLVSLSSKT